MLQMSLVYIVLWLSFQILVDCQMTSFNPRAEHTATHIDNKLYILGGILNGPIVNEFLYLDISGPFNTKALSWKDLSNYTTSNHYGAAAVVGGVNNNTLLLYGGNTTDTTMPLISTFDPIGKTWSPILVDIVADRKQNLVGVNSNGKIYLWGGMMPNITVTDDMFIINTMNYSFGKGSLIDAPLPAAYYGAVLLPNQKIIYMGGLRTSASGFSLLSFDEIYIYNTIDDKWNPNATTGLEISSRAGFSAVLGLDGQRIIIFGGTSDIHTYAPLVYEDSLYVLNLSNFEWFAPKSSGNIPKSRMFHKANVIGKYMVISFGHGYNQSIESDILLLDISNNEEYIWTYDFDVSNSHGNKSNNKPIIIGAIIGSLFGIVLGVFLRKWKDGNSGIQINPVAIDHF